MIAHDFMDYHSLPKKRVDIAIYPFPSNL